jgi:hypothetical protein
VNYLNCFAQTEEATGPWTGLAETAEPMVTTSKVQDSNLNNCGFSSLCCSCVHETRAMCCRRCSLLRGDEEAQDSVNPASLGSTRNCTGGGEEATRTLPAAKS